MNPLFPITAGLGLAGSVFGQIQAGRLGGRMTKEPGNLIFTESMAENRVLPLE